MRVRVLKQTDVRLGGEKRALFDGQVYDLAVDAAEELIAAGKAVSLEPTFQETAVDHSGRVEGETKPVEEKAVAGPPEDKALKPQRNKRRRRRG